MFTKFSISKILKEHVRTLTTPEGKYHPADFIVSYLLPVGVSFLLFYYNIDTLRFISNELLTIMSILLALILNLLVLIFNMRGSTNREYKDSVMKLLDQTYINSAYLCVISILIIISTLVFKVFGEIYYVNISANIIVVFLLSNFMITLFMVIKRFHNLMTYFSRVS